MILHDVPSKLLPQGRVLGHVRGLVARVLLEYAVNSTTGQRQLTQRDIATMVGADWQTVHLSLRSLQDEKAIRIERYNMFINVELLKKAAWVAEGGWFDRDKEDNH